MFAAKKKLKRQDFLFENGWFEQKVKKPGELQMQQFQISDCEQCSIYLLDSSACVYIDSCKFCTIFIGSSESSIFVRDSHHLTVICTTQQFRVRDCYDCRMVLFCESQPVVESSYGIQFCCFPNWGYQKHGEQMKEAKINCWNNNWFDIYDFTPKKFGLESNYTLTSLNKRDEEKLKNKFKQILGKEKMDFSEKYCSVPRCLGKHMLSLAEISILVIFPVIKPSQCESLSLIQSRTHNVTSEERNQLKIDIKGNGNSDKIEILFIKIGKSQVNTWKKVVKEIKMVIGDLERIELYQNSIFASFKDEH